MEVFLSELAATKLEELTEYLLSKWGYKVKNEYLVKLTKKIAQLNCSLKVAQNQTNLEESTNVC